MTLRKLLISLPIVTLAMPVIAQDAMIDANGDALYSYPEVQAVLPDMSLDDFTALDANGDGMLDADEVAVGVEAGLLPAQDG